MRRAMMILWFLFATQCGQGINGYAQDGDSRPMVDRELIVVAAPRHDDPYYADVADDILAFHLAYAERVESHDDFLVLTDSETYSAYADVLGEGRVVVVPQDDIWLRDFGLSNVVAPKLFKYTAEGQGGGLRGRWAARRVQKGLAALMREAALTFDPIDALNDGGNIVDDYAGRAVLSRKFLRDNRLTEDAARALLQRELGLQHVAFIESDEQGGLEHADGVVAFIAPNILVVNSYPEDPAYQRELIADLKAGLPGVTIHPIVTPYDGQSIYDAKFGSACGLYTNMLVTPHHIYLPQFGIPEDKEALAKLSSWSEKTIIPVRSDTVCHMGGGVRCMSWQLRGENAKTLRKWVRERG